MSRFRQPILAALLAAACLSAAACGGSSGSSSPTATATATTTATNATLESRDVKSMDASKAGGAVGDLPNAPPEGVSDKGFLRAVFDSAQALWDRKFAEAGIHYQDANLTFFHTAVQTGCGMQSAQTGPFYCPADHGVYLNTDFFDSLARQYRLTSPFAAGYVTAHEVAHHVQQLLGLHARVGAANAHDPPGANARSVRVELQADCYAGIWLHSVARAGELQHSDLEDILRAAAVVGDDYQRNKAGKDLAPESWTHGSSQQRVHWVTVGTRSGLPADCDTFAAG